MKKFNIMAVSFLFFFSLFTFAFFYIYLRPRWREGGVLRLRSLSTKKTKEETMHLVVPLLGPFKDVTSSL